jgi:hypothetical protein
MFMDVLLQSDISTVIAHAHGYYYFDISVGDSTFAVGFPSHDAAQEWLDCMLDVAGIVLRTQWRLIGSLRAALLYLLVSDPHRRKRGGAARVDVQSAADCGAH